MKFPLILFLALALLMFVYIIVLFLSNIEKMAKNKLASKSTPSPSSPSSIVILC